VKDGYDRKQPPAGNWRCDLEAAGGGALMDLGIHLILMNEVDPFALAQAMIEKLQWIDTLANRLWSPQPAPRGSVTFLTTRQLDPGFHP